MSELQRAKFGRPRRTHIYSDTTYKAHVRTAPLTFYGRALRLFTAHSLRSAQRLKISIFQNHKTLSLTMCHYTQRNYTCGCEKPEDFVQCGAHQDTNVRCGRPRRLRIVETPHMCRTHLIEAGRDDMRRVGREQQGQGPGPDRRQGQARGYIQQQFQEDARQRAEQLAREQEQDQDRARRAAQREVQRQAQQQAQQPAQQQQPQQNGRYGLRQGVRQGRGQGR
ncbi:uncharacterized protein E2P81_ATG10615 [Venturia nashicola]|nr:uncharacterized protein E2P81_ATG10615 [Venturia nashicola]